MDHRTRLVRWSTTLLERISDLERLLVYYNENHKHQAQNTNDPKFREWIFNKADIKKEVKRALRALIDDEATYYDQIRALIDEKISAAIPEDVSSRRSSAPSSP